MLLLERIVEAGAEFAVCEAIVGEGDAWVEDGRLTRAALFEIAAQTAATVGAGTSDRARVDREARSDGSGDRYLAGVSNTHFHGDAVVGDRLRARVEFGVRMGRLARCSFTVERVTDAVAATLLAEGDLSLVVG